MVRESEVAEFFECLKGDDVGLKSGVQSAMWNACERGNLVACRWLLKFGVWTDVNQACDDTGATPIFIAAEEGHLDVVRFLALEAQANVTQATTDNGATPIYIAAQEGHLDIVRFLALEAQANVNQA